MPIAFAIGSTINPDRITLLPFHPESHGAAVSPEAKWDPRQGDAAKGIWPRHRHFGPITQSVLRSAINPERNLDRA